MAINTARRRFQLGRYSFGSYNFRKAVVYRRYAGRYNQNKYGRRKNTPLTSKDLLDETFDIPDGIEDGEMYGEFFSYPSLGQGPGSRHTDKIRVVSLNLDGTIRIAGDVRRNVSVSDPMNEEEGIAEEPQLQKAELTKTDGLIGVYVVLDREPGTEEVPTFHDVFMEPQGRYSSKCDTHVRRDSLKRFRVLLREKMVVRDCTVGSILKVDRYLKFQRSNVINASFRENRISKDGRYNNVKENALLLYIIWEGCNRKIFVNINTRLVYYH